MVEKMFAKNFDIVGIGNAIVDILAYTTPAFLEKHSLHRGAMTLVDEKPARKLYKDMGAATECSGGSAANTMAGIANLGGAAVFIGRVKDDQFGDIFRHDMRALGVHCPTLPSRHGSGTGRCLVFVTHEENPLGGEGNRVERTMATYLGASTEIDENDIDTEIIAAAKVLYIEGYLWDSPSAAMAIQKAVRIAEEHGVNVAFALSDSLLVKRHRHAFHDFIHAHVQILFANEREIEALLDESDIRRILYHASKMCEIAVVTRSEKGSYILHDGAIHTVESEYVAEIYDVTGAGDLYAAGFLYGYVQGFPPEKCGKLGSLCAAEVIQFLGGRPITDLSKLIEKV